MTNVVAIMSMSLDGYVADANDGVAEVFDWYFSGDVEVSMPSTRSDMTFRVSAPSADHVRGLMAEVGAFLTGRRTFEVAHGWGGHTRGMYPLSSPPTTCPTAGHGPARRSSSSPTASKAPLHEPDRLPARSPWQCTALKRSSSAWTPGCSTRSTSILAAVLLGAGVRLFDHLANTPVVLGDPTVVTGVGVTHLRYPVHTS